MGQPVSDIEKHGLVSEPIQSGGHISRSRKRLAPLLLVLCLVLWLRTSTEELAHVISRDSVVAPSNTHLDHCSSIPPIGVVEFRERQKKLAGVLHELGAAAYITEPGPNALYFTNVSQSSWRTSERPFLLIITPEPESHGADAQLTVLTPAFEETRARLLTIPAPHTGLQYTSWQEDGDPYKTALNAVIKASGLDNGVIFVDEAARYFVADRLAKAGSGFEVKIAPPQVRALRERKSVAEIALMTCANEATLLAIRHTRERMYIGITASETSKILTKALGDAGLVGGGGLILFGDDAARPHGGGVDRSLAKDELVLIDVGGSLHGYVSDITRTFALPDSEIPSEHLEIWFIVQEAQNAAAKAARAGAVAGNVDKAARDVITRAGYGQYYTHRTGHGIGLEGHEDPYLRGNNHIRLVEQNAFSDEPGIYIDGKVGVRLEDVFVIDSRSGNALFLTDAVGGRAKDPWNP